METEGYIKIFGGIAVFIFTFMAKLFIERETKTADWHKSLIDLPVNIFFLALSLLFAFSVKATSHYAIILIVVICYMSLSLLIIFLSRKCLKKYDVNSKLKSWMWLFLLNIILASACLSTSISLLIRSPQEEENILTVDKPSVVTTPSDSSLIKSEKK